MASSINKYAQNVARARYQTQGGTHSVPVSGRHAPTIDPSLFSGKSAKKPPTGESGSGGLASRIVEGLSSGGKGGGGESLPAQEYDPVTDAESGEDPNVPRGATVETQQPITQRGVDPRFMIQGNGPRIDLSGFFPERANTSYDPSKAIGGENVPYKPAGFFRSFLGDPANRKNIEFQQAQGAKWEAEAAGEKERANKMEDRLTEIKALDEGPAARFAATEKRLTAEQKRLADKEINDEIERNNAIDLGLVQAGNESVLKDADMVRKALSDEQEGKRKDRELDIRESAIKPPRYSPIGNTGMFQTPEGELAVFEPETMRISDALPGRPAKFRMLTGEGSKPPGRSIGDEEVDRITGKTKTKLDGPLPAPLGPEYQNTALVPRFMQGAGKAFGSAATTATDPLRMLSTDIYKTLFSSGAQQDPEVLKRMKARQAAQGTENAVDYGPMF